MARDVERRTAVPMGGGMWYFVSRSIPSNKNKGRKSRKMGGGKVGGRCAQRED